MYCLVSESPIVRLGGEAAFQYSDVGVWVCSLSPHATVSCLPLIIVMGRCGTITYLPAESRGLKGALETIRLATRCVHAFIIGQTNHWVSVVVNKVDVGKVEVYFMDRET